MNGLGLKSGQASTGPHAIDHRYDTMTRQRRRRQRQVEEMLRMRQEFGGCSADGNLFWPVEMPRRVARAIARVRAAA